MRITTGVILAAMAALTITACGTTRAAVHPPATRPATTPAAATSESKFSNWYADGGQAQTDAVHADLVNLKAAIDANKTSEGEQDGAALASDAGAALSDPPPEDTAQYKATMSALVTAGNYIATDDFTDAPPYLGTGVKDDNLLEDTLTLLAA
jgi:hypothetical protein